MARKKPKNNLVRKSKGLKLTPKILIVCEGERTEPDYFEYLKKRYRLSTAQIIVKGDGGSSPNSVYTDALNEYNNCLSKHQVAYEKVYCVYDRDEFSKHAEVKDKIKQQKAFDLIFSDPCFEVWYLFHFDSSTKPFARKGNKTASQQVKSQVTKLLKAQGVNHLQILFDRIDIAIENAKNNEKQNINNPYTNVYKLVEELAKHKR